MNTSLVTTWSSFGHRFISGDDDKYDYCLTCGAMYLVVPTPDEPWDFKWTANDGSQPDECSMDTGRVHGDERVCDKIDCHLEDDRPCRHESHCCNCVACM